MTEEARALAGEYLQARVVNPDSEDDALHIAIATVYRADLIVSWNFKHFVNVERIRRFNAVNLQQGFYPIDIRPPKEVVPYED